MKVETMKAQVLVAARRVEEREVPVPRADEDEVVLRVEACAITNRDLRDFVDGPRDGKPIILGRQLCGEIIEVGSGVSDLHVGQRAAPVDAIGRSVSWCFGGPKRTCDGTWKYDASPSGGFARYVKLPASSCAIVPELVDNYDGAMLASLAGALHASNQMGAPLGSACIVYGEQPVCTALARAGALAPIIVISDDKEYSHTARKLGANYLLAANEEGLSKAAQLVEGIPYRVLLTDPDSRETVAKAFDWCNWSTGNSETVKPDWTAWHSAVRILGYGRIDLRPAYSLAVPLADLEWALKESLSNPSLTKVFVAPSLNERVYFESQRKPFEGTVTPG